MDERMTRENGASRDNPTRTNSSVFEKLKSSLKEEMPAEIRSLFAHFQKMTIQVSRYSNKENSAEIIETPNCTVPRTQSTPNRIIRFEDEGNCELDESRNRNCWVRISPSSDFFKKAENIAVQAALFILIPSR